MIKNNWIKWILTFDWAYDYLERNWNRYDSEFKANQREWAKLSIEERESVLMDIQYTARGFTLHDGSDPKIDFDQEQRNRASNFTKAIINKEGSMMSAADRDLDYFKEVFVKG
jgi:hypothetical protein